MLVTHKATALSESAEVERAQMIEIFANTPRFIFNAGCALPPTTAPEYLRALIATAREWSG
jgi:uroporphyrinogen-III decarboxylase